MNKTKARSHGRGPKRRKISRIASISNGDKLIDHVKLINHVKHLSRVDTGEDLFAGCETARANSKGGRGVTEVGEWRRDERGARSQGREATEIWEQRSDKDHPLFRRQTFAQAPPRSQALQGVRGVTELSQPQSLPSTGSLSDGGRRCAPTLANQDPEGWALRHRSVRAEGSPEVGRLTQRGASRNAF